jgi:hypothetical protein
VLDSAGARQQSGQLPGVADFDFLRGDAFGQASRLAEAEAAFRRELAAFPGNAQASARLALILAMTGKPRSEVHGVLEAMWKVSPTADRAELAARTLDTLGDAHAAAAWRARAPERRRDDRDDRDGRGRPLEPGG